jgi:F-type H+-transporting ATPase subunit epsilon
MLLSIITPEKILYNGEIASLKIKTNNGYIQILSNHCALVTALQPSSTEFVDSEGKKTTLFTAEGMLKVEKNKVTVLCNSAEWSSDIDRARAQAARERAEHKMKGSDYIDRERAELALKRAIERLKVK